MHIFDTLFHPSSLLPCPHTNAIASLIKASDAPIVATFTEASTPSTPLLLLPDSLPTRCLLYLPSTSTHQTTNQISSTLQLPVKNPHLDGYHPHSSPLQSSHTSASPTDIICATSSISSRPCPLPRFRLCTAIPSENICLTTMPTATFTLPRALPRASDLASVFAITCHPGVAPSRTRPIDLGNLPHQPVTSVA